MAEPTDADKALAKKLAYSHQEWSPGRVNAIAQALADVHAEYEAVAVELDDTYSRPGWEWDEAAKAALYASDRIRQVRRGR